MAFRLLIINLMELENLSQKTIPTKVVEKKFDQSKYSQSIILLNCRQLVAAKEYELALALGRYGLCCFSTNEPITLLVHEVLETLGKKDEALDLLQKSQKWYYSKEKAIRLSVHLYQEGFGDQALQALFEVLSDDGIDADLLLSTYKNIGNVYLKLGEIDLAEEFFHKAFRLNPDDVIILTNLGVLNYIKRDLEIAKDNLRTALKININNSKTWAVLAMVHAEFGDRELSWGNLMKAIELDPFNKSALQLLCELAESDFEFSSVQSCLCDYLESNNFDEDVSHWLVSILVKRNMFELALLEAFKTYIWNPTSIKNKDIYDKISQFIELRKRGVQE